jgi:microcin C transport system ATP-binding protein
MPEPLLSLENVSIAFGERAAVDHLDLEVHAGERLALVGESGSGKTVTALSILRLLGKARIQGSIRFDGKELLTQSEDDLRRIRGAQISMIFQEPMTALNPLLPVGAQIAETLIVHEGLLRAAARHKAVELLAQTGIREPTRRVDSFPHQLSGGERQRAVIAMALACRPKLLIADEPTTALDLTVRSRIIELLLDLQKKERERRGDRGMSILLITHDLPLVRRFAERVAVMERGSLVEVGTTEDVFERPRHRYTKKLLASTPRRMVDKVPEDAATVLAAEALRVEYPKARPGVRGWFSSERFVALQGAALALRAGETIGVVGESGSGKSTLAQAILGLVRVESGTIAFEGANVARLGKRERRALCSRLQVVFQDPFGSLSPRQNVGQIVGEGLALHFPHLGERARRERIVTVLSDVGLSESMLSSYPDEFSGGQRQRISIARALVLRPKVVILDEPTSALDLSIQNQVLRLLIGLQKKYGLSYVLITHDLTVVHAMAHRVYVLRDGEIVETGRTQEVLTTPRHAYTRGLVSASA